MDFYNTSEMKEILQKHDFKFSKAMGQNFLIDSNITEKIVRLSGIDKSHNVLEVGPGLGSLTAPLCCAAGHVTAVELDGKLIPLLRDALSAFDNLEILQGDILKLDIKTLITQNTTESKNSVCANLPYNITTPALTAFIDAGVFGTITVMIQREVAQRICAKPGTSDYGAFTVYANYHTSSEILFTVPPECFMPRPKVHSAVITMKVRKQLPLAPDAERMFFRVVHAAFGQRRKTLVNALSAQFGSDISKPDLSDIVRRCGFDDKIRGETLGIPEFIKLSELISDFYSK